MSQPKPCATALPASAWPSLRNRLSPLPNENRPMTELDLTTIAAAQGGSQPLHGYLATPSGNGPWPGLVMIHEIFGIDDVMRRHADRLAAPAYLTPALSLYSAGSARRGP